MDDPDTVESMIRACVQSVSIPVSAKIRVFPCIDKTIEFARMLERAGCSFICTLLVALLAR